MDRTGSADPRSRIGDLILNRLADILDRLARLERYVDNIAMDIDDLDRGLRPHGDGTRLRRPHRG